MELNPIKANLYRDTLEKIIELKKTEKGNRSDKRIPAPQNDKALTNR